MIQSTYRSTLLVFIGIFILGGLFFGFNTTTAQTPNCSFTRDLSVGSRGQDVNCLQRFLTSQGFFGGTTTNYFGPLTQSAVINWQRSHRITPAQGYFGPASRSVYQDHVSESTSLATAGSGNTTVATVRSQLQEQIRTLMLEVIDLLKQRLVQTLDQRGIDRSQFDHVLENTPRQSNRSSSAASSRSSSNSNRSNTSNTNTDSRSNSSVSNDSSNNDEGGSSSGGSSNSSSDSNSDSNSSSDNTDSSSDGTSSNDGNTSSRTATGPERSISVDGSTADWNGINAYVLNENNPGSGAPSFSNLSGSFKFAYDGNRAYFLIDVIDNQYDISGGDYIWDRDGVEIMLNGDNDKGSYDSNDHKFMIRADAEEIASWSNGLSSISGADVIAESQRTANGYRLEVGIRWSEIGGQPPDDGTTYGFNVAVNDRDNESYAHQKHWWYASNHSFTTADWETLQLPGDSDSLSPAEQDSDDDQQSSSDQQSDTTAPTISNIQESTDTDRATISWSTNEVADSEVEYGTSNGNYSSTVSDDSNVTSHSLSVTGLNDDTTYHYRIISTDEAGNTRATSNRTFTTDRQQSQSSSGDGSRSGDEQALEDLYAATNGSNWDNRSGWGSNMSLSDNIYGVTTEQIDGELRVTEIDLRNNSLAGSIDIPELANLKELRMFNVMINDLNSDFPDAITQATNLEYLYLSGSDGTSDLINKHPHEEASDGGQTIHTGKHKGNEGNRFHGRIPDNIDDLQNLKWFVLSWTDHIDRRTLIEADGITYVPQSIWNIASLEGLMLNDNWNIARSGNTLEFPDSIAHMKNLTHVKLGGGSGTQWDSDEEGWVVGGMPDDINQLTKIREFVPGSSRVTELPDLSGSPELRAYSFGGTGFDDQPFPAWLIDGSVPKINAINLGSGVGDKFLAGPEVDVRKGLTGEIPEFGKTNLMSFTVSFSKLTGSIPKSFWTTKSGGPRKNLFYHNNFTSLGTTDLTHLWRTEHIRVSHNLISEPWPNLNWQDPPPMKWVWFDHNKYVFKHLLYVPDNAPNGETIFELYQNLNIESSFRYKPQKPFGEAATITVQAGNTVRINNFNTIVEHKDNRYQWYKDGNKLSGKTSRELTIYNAQNSDEGTYILKVTNPGVPELTLESEEINVSVGSVSGVQTYGSVQEELNHRMQQALDLLQELLERKVSN